MASYNQCCLVFLTDGGEICEKANFPPGSTNLLKSRELVPDKKDNGESMTPKLIHFTVV